MGKLGIPPEELATLLTGWVNDKGIAVTGHRPQKLGNEWDGIGYYSDRARDNLQEVIYEFTPQLLISGMALGIDMIWAELAIDNHIPFIAAVPCVGQENLWSDRQQKRYWKLVNHPLCDMKIITASLYTPEVMQIRNQWMVDNCDMMVAVWDGLSGGTGNCVKYAKGVGRKLLIFKP